MSTVLPGGRSAGHWAERTGMFLEAELKTFTASSKRSPQLRADSRPCSETERLENWQQRDSPVPSTALLSQPHGPRLSCPGPN